MFSKKTGKIIKKHKYQCGRLINVFGVYQEGIFIFYS